MAEGQKSLSPSRLLLESPCWQMTLPAQAQRKFRMTTGERPPPQSQAPQSTVYPKRTLPG